MARATRTEPTVLTFPNVRGPEPTSGTSRPSQPGQRVITVISLIVGLFGVIWIFGHRASHPSRSSDRTSVVNRDAGKSPKDELYLPAPELQSPANAAIGSEQASLANAKILNAPVYVANLADRIGRYLVSVRKVNGLAYSFDANPTAAGIGAGTSQLIVSLQVMAADGGDVEEVESLADDFIAIDDTGRRLSPVEHRVFKFDRGFGEIVRLPMPDSRATCLRLIQGRMRLLSVTADARSHGTTAPNETRSHPVRITRTLPYAMHNAPIPWYPHIFGVAGALVMPSERVTPTTKFAVKSQVSAFQNMRLLRGDAATGVFTGVPSAAFEANGVNLPVRLNMPDRLISTFSVPLIREATDKTVAVLAPGHLNISITPHIGIDGEITVDIAEPNSAGALARGISVWDNEPVALAIPMKQLRGFRTASGDLLLYLHLFLASNFPERLFNGALPRNLVPKAGERGAQIIGSIGTQEDGLGMGYAHMEIVRLNAQGQPGGEAQRIRVALDHSGQFSLSNIVAGRYRLRLIDAVPTLSPLVDRRSFEDYIAHRFHLVHPVLANPSIEVTAIAGVPVTMERWRYESSEVAK